jgi:hypothetical protein
METFMKHQTLDEFLQTNGWSVNLKDKLQAISRNPETKYLVAWDNAGQLSASAYTDRPDEWPETAVAIWSKDKDLDPATKSRTMLAVDRVEKDGMTVYAAAKALGINQSAVHRAIKRREDKDVCPQCNQVIRSQSA